MGTCSESSEAVRPLKQEEEKEEKKAATQGSFGKFYINHYNLHSIRIWPFFFLLKMSEPRCGQEDLAVPPPLSLSGTVREVLTGEYDMFPYEV